MHENEGPSDADLDRFGGETAFCDNCGAEIWDQADVCPDCLAPLAGGPRSRSPQHAALRRNLFVLVAIVALVAFLLLVL